MNRRNRYALPHRRKKADDSARRKENASRRLGETLGSTKAPSKGKTARTPARPGVDGSLATFNHGADFVSVPVWWFRNGPFKKGFKSPNSTFLVHYVALSDTSEGVHYLALFGSGKADVQCNEETYKQFRDNWVRHGRPMVPSYKLSSKGDPYEPIDLLTPTRKKRKTGDGRTPRPRQHKTLYERHAIVRQDWGHIHLRRGDLGLRYNHKYGLFRDTPTETSTQFADTLVAVVDRLLTYRDPWTWMANSCHLDTWLMVELAWYDTLAGRRHLFDGLVLSSTRLYSLFKVLLAVGSGEQNDLRHAYWAMEIEAWRGPALRGSFGKNADYDGHRDLLYSECPAPAISVRVSVSRALVCSSPDHEDTITQTHLRSIHASKVWYSMPSSHTRKQVQVNGVLEWRMPTVDRHIHTDIPDALATVIARSDSTLTMCKRCNDSVVEATKLPDQARLPASLALQVAFTQIPVEEHFSLGGVGYSLISIVFGNGTHFICNVKIRGYWYHYDDMGIRGCAPPPGDSRVPNPPRLVRTSASFLTPSSPAGYKPVTLRYIRDNTETLEAVPMVSPADVPNQKQFQEFHILEDDEQQVSQVHQVVPPTPPPALTPRKPRLGMKRKPGL